MSEETEKNIGRNEPCPCGSGKKFKRCCGVGAAPKLSAPAANSAGAAGGMPGGPGGFDPASMGLDQAKMMEIAQSLQRLPKGQLQRVQALMQRAMAGKDVSREAAEFEKTLPVEMQEMLRGLQMPNMPGMPGAAGLPAAASSPSAESEMTEEQARQLVAQAAAEGKIAQDEAAKLLTGSESASEKESKMGRFWKSLGGKKGS